MSGIAIRTKSPAWWGLISSRIGFFSVEANDGVLSVRNIPGTGCVFTIDLPRHSLPIASAATGMPSDLLVAID